MAYAARQRYGARFARAYDYETEGNAARVAQPRRPRRSEESPRPGVRVISGSRSTNPALQGISPEYAFAFKLAIVVIVAIAIVCSIRVFLSSSTVAALEQVNALESSIASAQAATNELEIKHSKLSSSARIEQEATNLGMVAPESVTYLKIAIPGKVVLKADGSISLSGTLSNSQDYIASHSS